MSIHPFVVDIPQSTLDDLQARLQRTRLTDDAGQSGWDSGTDPDYLRQLVAYWHQGFDWRAQEARINQFRHFRAGIDGFGIHFLHQRGKGENPLPLLLTHGYPDSFLRFMKVIPMLTDPETFGGDAADSFDVVVPSLPGYGFSDKPAKPGMTLKIADLWAKLMTEELGYLRFAAHGGDWGSMVTEHLARDHSDSVVGIHLTDVPFSHLFQKPDEPSAKEKRFLKAAEKWQQKEGAYALIQGTRPGSLAPALGDSPAGLAAWMVEKFYRWSDCDGDVENCFSKDELLTNITLYWATDTIYSSFLPYYDSVNAGPLTWMTEAVKGWTGSSRVPAGFASFPRDLLPPPREWAERFFNIQRWTEMPRGGHFAALEQPELLVGDLRDFFRPLREVSSPVSTTHGGTHSADPTAP